MKGLFLIAAVVLACSFKDCKAAEPTILVKVHFALSWTEMCLIEKYLKTNVARQIVTKTNDGALLDIKRIVLYNFNKHCPEGSAEHAVVEMFVSKSDNNNDPSNIDEDMTKMLYKVLYYLYEQKQERYMGDLFVAKISGVTVTGKNAPPPSTAYTEIERLYIGIGVACIILLVIIVILVAISCYKNRKNRKQDRYSNRAEYKSNNDEAVRTYPQASQADNRGYEEDRNGAQNADYRMSTRF